MLLVLSLVGNYYYYREINALKAQLQAEEKNGNTTIVKQVEQKVNPDSEQQKQIDVVNFGKTFVEIYFGATQPANRENNLRRITTPKVQEKIFPQEEQGENNFEPNYQIQIDFNKTYFNWESENKANVIFKVTTMNTASQIKLVYDYEIELKISQASNGWIISGFDIVLENVPMEDPAAQE